MTNVQTIELLKRLGACRDAKKWLGDRDLATAWRECPRGDWLLWLAANMPDRKPVVRAACACARLALPYVLAGETRPSSAIETVERWASGDEMVTEEQLRIAADDAYAATAAYPTTAADAAANAVDAATSAAITSTADNAYAAAVYAAAAVSVFETISRSEVLSRCADLVRHHISEEMIVGALTAAQAVTAE